MNREEMKQDGVEFLNAIAEAGISLDDLHKMLKAWINATYCKSFNERDFAFHISNKVCSAIEINKIFNKG
ncbi:MAG TPA: hypothetical protein PKA15_03630 [Chitinophagales bacterium]|nr:hypothetical protein [Chitinophagales bacterium]HMY41913.1 hypothetical protein [Chitinophagales bacterium]